MIYLPWGVEIWDHVSGNTKGIVKTGKSTIVSGLDLQKNAPRHVESPEVAWQHIREWLADIATFVAALGWDHPCVLDCFDKKRPVE
eukprot:2584873-Amphidinium_carterae.1